MRVSSVTPATVGTPASVVGVGCVASSSVRASVSTTVYIGNSTRDSYLLFVL